MSESSTPESRTEKPTARRMGNLRSEGALYHSVDIEQLATLVAGFYVLRLTWSWLVENLKIVLRASFARIGHDDLLTIDDMRRGFLQLLLLMAPPIFVISAVVAVISILAVMLQTNWNIKAKLIHFQFNFINPVEGIKRMFSVRGFTSTMKALFKLAIILPVGYLALKSYAPQILPLMHTSVEQVMVFSAKAIMSLFWEIFWILLAFAVIDFVWGKFQWNKSNKMTKDEVKDERKSQEGDEDTKRKMQAKGMQRIARRIQMSVPKADVVITNPTHISVALQYDRASMTAPVVVAKGKGYIALRIREIAREHSVPIIERKPVARALYESTEVGATIPRELFKAVAEILAYVYRLKNPYKYLKQERA